MEKSKKVFKAEAEVDSFVQRKLIEKGLDEVDIGLQGDMPEYLKDALKGGSKSLRKGDSDDDKDSYGIPDLNITCYDVPVLIEDKLSANRLIKVNKDDEITKSKTAIKDYAVNGVIHYARSIIKSRKYNDCVAIGIAGNTPDDLKIAVYYVYAVNGEPKHMEAYDNNLSFLLNEDAFNSFLRDASLSETEKHAVLIRSQKDLMKRATGLNRLMNNLNISVDQRVVYVSGMLLAMQPVKNKDHEVIEPGLTPDKLEGIQTSGKRDAKQLMSQLGDFLEQRGNIAEDKYNLMMDSFKDSILNDAERDKLIPNDRLVAKYIKENKSSKTKQIFVFIYYEVFEQIGDDSGSLDIMGSMYSEFLKYALSDGAALGKVLTPPYVTNLMAKAIGVSVKDHVMDITAGSGAFLVSSMKIMIDEANYEFGKSSAQANKEITNITHNRLLGIELDAKMYTLAASNMILRGDGSSQIKQADSLSSEAMQIMKDFGPNKFLLNPPFKYESNGMPFLEKGLEAMRKSVNTEAPNRENLAAIIIQDSAGNGQAKDAKEINQKILEHNTLLASIKMPHDLFNPSAMVQTSIYIFRAGQKHKPNRAVKFIDFRNDGQKRTKRKIVEVDHSAERYSDLLRLLDEGKDAARNDDKFHNELWDLDRQYIEAPIDNSGCDWNFENHQKIDTTPKQKDFEDTVKDYLAFEIVRELKEK